MTRTFLAGADVVLPDRVASGLTVVLEGDRISDLTVGPRSVGANEVRVDVTGHLIAPGFIDVHVHGAMGVDVLDGPHAVLQVARHLPRWGVTSFCPTAIACSPAALAEFLAAVAGARATPPANSARVLPAHLESNFISPEFRGAQPLECLRVPPKTTSGVVSGAPFSAADIWDTIIRGRPDVGILTMAPELPGGLDLLRECVAAGIRVSLGHSGATFDEAQAAIGAGARHATHLFNRMRPMTHREPGLVGAILASEEIAAELICDGHHVHPAVLRLAIAAKGTARTMAITDGTAGSGLPPGSRATLGGREITVTDVARLDDGTMAGSVATMDRVFATLVTAAGQSLVEAATLCATTPARELGLTGQGVISPGSLADLTVLTGGLRVAQTWVGGTQVWGPSS